MNFWLGNYVSVHTSYSGTQGDKCVEVAVTPQAVHVRDSKDIERRPFAVGREGWTRFVRYAAED